MSNFTCEQETSLVYKFTFSKEFNDEDFRKFLGILTRFLELKKPFSFYVDATAASIAPLNIAMNLINWMKKSKPIIKSEKKFIGGAVVLKSKTITNVLTTVLKVQKPICPVKITTDMDSVKQFIKKITDDYTLNKTINITDESYANLIID
jgi:hypothetical protein